MVSSLSTLLLNGLVLRATAQSCNLVATLFNALKLWLSYFPPSHLSLHPRPRWLQLQSSPRHSNIPFLTIPCLPIATSLTDWHWPLSGVPKGRRKHRRWDHCVVVWRPLVSYSRRTTRNPRFEVPNTAGTEGATNQLHENENRLVWVNFLGRFRDRRRRIVLL